MCLIPVPNLSVEARKAGILLCSKFETSYYPDKKTIELMLKLYGSGRYEGVTEGMSKKTVEALPGYGDRKSQSTMNGSHWEMVYHRQQEDFSYVIIFTYLDGKVYSKQEITR